MSTKEELKERMERYVLGFARDLGLPIPSGEIKGEGPDFRFENESPQLGIEVSEILKSPETNDGILPVAQEAMHQAIMATADREYHSDSAATPVKVNVYWEDARGQWQDRDEMTAALVEFVRAHVHLAQPFAAYGVNETPKGFSSITLDTLQSEHREWWGGECLGYKLEHIKPEVEFRIAEKNRKVDKYRSRMQAGSQQWLLLYSDVGLSRGMMIPAGAETWRFPFQFERVFWVDLLERNYIELQRLEAAATV